MSDDESVLFPGCEGMTHIVKTLDFGPTILGMLEKGGIHSVNDLVDKRDDLRKKEAKEKNTGKKKRYGQLISISLYVEHIYEVHGLDADLRKVFVESELDSFEGNRQKALEQSLDNVSFGYAPMTEGLTQDRVDTYIRQKIPEALRQITQACQDELVKCSFGPSQFVHLLLRARQDGPRLRRGTPA